MGKKSDPKIKCHSLNSELSCWYHQVHLGEVGQDCWSLGIPRQQTFRGQALGQAHWSNTRSKYRQPLPQVGWPRRGSGLRSFSSLPTAVQRGERCLCGPFRSACLLPACKANPNDPKCPFLPALSPYLLPALGLNPISCIVITWH